MKKLFVIAALLLTGVSSASAALGDMPSSDALSYGKTSSGCYYVSEAHDLVYTRNFTGIAERTSCRDGEDFSTIRDYRAKHLMQWWIAQRNFLLNLASKQ